MSSLSNLPHHPPPLVEWVGKGPYRYTSVQMTEYGIESWNAAIKAALDVCEAEGVKWNGSDGGESVRTAIIDMRKLRLQAPPSNPEALSYR